jgi:maleylpyruvate isomerase
LIFRDVGTTEPLIDGMADSQNRYLGVVHPPDTDIERVVNAHHRLASAISQLSDDIIGRASRLPDWTIGHVLTHLARNADSHVRRAEAASSGTIIDQYPGGLAGREAEIAKGAGRPAGEITEDVKSSATSVETAWRELSERDWMARSRDANGHERFLFELPARRWQEVEVHLVDLDIGVSHLDWSDDFVLEWLPRTRERMWDRIPAASRSVLFDSPAEELAWLYGRVQRPGLPPAPPWG